MEFFSAHVKPYYDTDVSWSVGDVFMPSPLSPKVVPSFNELVGGNIGFECTASALMYSAIITGMFDSIYVRADSRSWRTWALS